MAPEQNLEFTNIWITWPVFGCVYYKSDNTTLWYVANNQFQYLLLAAILNLQNFHFTSSDYSQNLNGLLLSDKIGTHNRHPHFFRNRTIRDTNHYRNGGWPQIPQSWFCEICHLHIVVYVCLIFTFLIATFPVNWTIRQRDRAKTTFSMAVDRELEMATLWILVTWPFYESRSATWFIDSYNRMFRSWDNILNIWKIWLTFATEDFFCDQRWDELVKFLINYN